MKHEEFPIGVPESIVLEIAQLSILALLSGDVLTPETAFDEALNTALSTSTLTELKKPIQGVVTTKDGEYRPSTREVSTLFHEAMAAYLLKEENLIKLKNFIPVRVVDENSKGIHPFTREVLKSVVDLRLTP